ncbi:MAG TPA: DUF1697 domain-containing protein, partial [Roseiarcus sp.]
MLARAPAPRNPLTPTFRTVCKAYAGKPVGVIVRTAAEMAKVVALNPFPDRAANQTVAIFLDYAPPP